MELHHLRYFVEVARRSSVTRAAEALHMAQPSLSIQVKRLEEELGVPLLDRTGRRVRLTPAGEVFLRRAAGILAEVEAAVVEIQEFQGVGRGRITVGTTRISGSHLLPPALAAFRRLHPGVEVVLREEDTSTLVALTRCGDVDVSLVTPPGDVADLEVVPLLTEPLLLAVPPDHPLATRTDVELGEAAREAFILLKEGMGFRRVVLQACAAAGFQPRVVFESSDLETIQSLVAVGMGVTLVPRMTAECLRIPHPLFLTLRSPCPTRTLFLAWRRDRYQTQAARAFVDLMVSGAVPGPLGAT